MKERSILSSQVNMSLSACGQDGFAGVGRVQVGWFRFQLWMRVFASFLYFAPSGLLGFFCFGIAILESGSAKIMSCVEMYETFGFMLYATMMAKHFMSIGNTCSLFVFSPLII